MISNANERSAPETQPAKVSIVIPCRAEYVAVARLAILGVANRLAFSYDEVEDVRLAVGEACTHAVERSRSASPRERAEPTLWIDSMITGEGLAIDVRDNIPVVGDPVPQIEDANELGFDRQDLGALLMEILVDSVSTDSGDDGTTVHLFKASPLSQTNIRAES